MQVRNDCPEMKNDLLPLSPAPLELTTAAMALTGLTIQAMYGDEITARLTSEKGNLRNVGPSDLRNVALRTSRISHFPN